MENLKSQIKFIHEMETEELVEEAEEEARKTVKDAEERAAQIKKEKMEEVSEKLHDKEASELAVTKLEGKKKILNLKSRLVEDAISKSMDKLKTIVEGGKAQYRDSLERLIIEGATTLKGTQFQILTNSRDKKIVKESLRDLEKKISKLKGAAVSLQIDEETLNAMGGAIIQRPDKRQMFNDTLEARITWVRQEKIGEIFASLFKGEEE
jgi:V/A-type H+-transporting ATPase subunit E